MNSRSRSLMRVWREGVGALSRAKSMVHSSPAQPEAAKTARHPSARMRNGPPSRASTVPTDSPVVRQVHAVARSACGIQRETSCIWHG